jgi:phosphoglycerate dehydrogenase-like enzyme
LLKGLYILDPAPYDWIYGPAERADIAELVSIYAPAQTRQSVAANPAILADAEVIFSGWGAPEFTADVLAAAPRLRAVFYGAGSIRGVATDALWERGVLITSAYAANAVPVSEYALSQILFCLKHGWQLVFRLKRERAYPPREINTAPGAYGSTVGILSLGMVGRLVCEHLKPFDVKVIAYDPFATPADAAALGVELCGLDDVFRRSDVVSLHTPWLKETEGMIAGRHFDLLKPGAAFINTARGAVVREDEMIAALIRRPDLFAVLDVTHPEPPAPDSPLFTLPNVALTPHIAGSMNDECHRQGRYMVDELRRYTRGEPLRWAISRERARILA